MSGSRSNTVRSGTVEPNNSTQMFSEWRRTICAGNIKGEMSKFLGDDFVKTGEGTWRSLDGKRQFRVVPANYNGGHGDLPRIGQEVIVDFLNGNIDQPIIVGRLSAPTSSASLHAIGVTDYLGNK